MKIPDVYWEFTTPRLLVLEYIDGVKIDDDQALNAWESTSWGSWPAGAPKPF